MSAVALDGKAAAQRVLSSLAPRVARLKERNLVATLRVVRVGEDAASRVYVGAKLRACAQVGIDAAAIELPATADQQRVVGLLSELNADQSVHGILVQLPLPAQIDPYWVSAQLDPLKDVDGFHPVNLGHLLQGRTTLAPCTASGVIRLLDDAGIDIGGKNAVVVGRGEIAGKPLALMLTQRDATVTVCHSRTRELAVHTRAAEILCVAAGRSGLVHGDMIKPGAVVIDVGVNRAPDGKLTGDVDATSALARASHYTPVPGGVGPMTVAMLIENTVRAAEMQQARINTTSRW